MIGSQQGKPLRSSTPIEKTTNTKGNKATSPGPETEQPQLYQLNSKALPLQINFNPLMVTFSLFLRALADKKESEELQSCHKLAAIVDHE